MILEVGFESVDLNERIFIIASNTGSILATFLIYEAQSEGASRKRVVLTQHEPSYAQFVEPFLPKDETACEE